MIEPCIFADEVAKDFHEAARACAEAGAKSIELRGGIWGKRVQDADDADVRRMQEVLAETGMRIGVIGSPVGKCNMDSDEECAQHVQWLERMCDLAATFGTDVVRGFAFWNPVRERHDPAKREPIERRLDRVVERMKPFLDVLARHGATMAIESEAATMVGTAREWRQLYEALGRPAQLSFCWDVNNAHSCGEEPLPDGYEAARGQIRHVHVKPNAEKNILTVAGSRTSYEEVLRRLIADGYTDAAGIEHWGSPALMLEGVRQLVALLARLQGRG